MRRYLDEMAIESIEVSLDWLRLCLIELLTVRLYFQSWGKFCISVELIAK